MAESRTLKLLNLSISNNNYYEAHQHYISLFNRYKKLNNYDAAITILSEGVLLLLLKNQINSAYQLSELLIDGVKENGLSENNIKVLSNVFSNYPDEEGEKKIQYMKSAINMTIKLGGSIYGNEKLNLLLARYYMSIKDYNNSSKYYSRTGIDQDALDENLSLFKLWKESINESEYDLLLTKFILYYLCCENLKGANYLYTNIVLNSKIDESMSSPLLNYIRFLLLTCERNAVPLFTMLRNKYSDSLKRDESFEILLDRIGKLWFDIKPTNNNLGSLLAEMLSN